MFHIHCRVHEARAIKGVIALVFNNDYLCVDRATGARHVCAIGVTKALDRNFSSSTAILYRNDEGDGARDECLARQRHALIPRVIRQVVIRKWKGVRCDKSILIVKASFDDLAAISHELQSRLRFQQSIFQLDQLLGGEQWTTRPLNDTSSDAFRQDRPKSL
ncbi:hypothetical protein D3C81_458770 [compost metagenome]